MSKVHYREGMWDTFAAVKFVEWMKGLEDPARDENGFVLECKRAILTSALWIWREEGHFASYAEDGGGEGVFGEDYLLEVTWRSIYEMYKNK